MNIMDEYIKLRRRQITDYMRLVLDNKFIRKYSDDFLDTYINSRYYDSEENKTQLKGRILKEIDKKREELKENFEGKERIIEDMSFLYKQVLYFDNVIKTSNIEKIVDKICDKRQGIDNLKEKLLELLEKFNLEKKDLLEIIKSDEFDIELKKITNKYYIYEVSLKYNIKFPYLYSRYAIQKAFNMGTVMVDKLFIEYNLISGQILEDMAKDNINRQYILEFTDAVFKKKQKFKKLMEIIKKPLIQERVSLKIDNKILKSNKESIYDLMREGFRFSIYLDDESKFNSTEIEKFKMFKYVIVEKESICYDNIKKYKTKIKNLIEI